MQEVSYSTFDRSAFLSDPDNLLFDLPLEKSADATEERWLVQGIASCEATDADGEEIIQKGMDCAPLMQSGYINWDHRDKDGPAYLIGYPIEFRFVRARDYAGQLGKSVDGPALWVKGELYKNKPIAKAVWDHMDAAKSTPRQLGWSVQGRVLKRDDVRKSRVLKSAVHQLAITHQPKQLLTFAEIAKSFSGLTTQSSQPLLRENVHGRMTSLLYGECKKGCYGDDMKFKKGIGGALRHLADCHHKELQKSAAFLQALKEQDYQF